jgi:hypothetical protein
VTARGISTVFGLVSALSTLAVAGGYVVRWLGTPVYREPPLSQPEYFFITALIGVLALVEAVLALRRSDTLRVLAMPAVAGVIVVTGVGASLGFDEVGYWLLLAGAIGLLAAVFAAAEPPRRVLTAVLGLIAALPLAVALGFVQRLLR